MCATTGLFKDLSDNGLGVFPGLQIAHELTQRSRRWSRNRGRGHGAARRHWYARAAAGRPPANTRPTRIYGTGVGPKWIATPSTRG